MTVEQQDDKYDDRLEALGNVSGGRVIECLDKKWVMADQAREKVIQMEVASFVVSLFTYLLFSFFLVYKLKPPLV